MVAWTNHCCGEGQLLESMFRLGLQKIVFTQPGPKPDFGEVGRLPEQVAILEALACHEIRATPYIPRSGYRSLRQAGFT